MQVMDLINSLFELSAAGFLLLNVLQLRKDKEVKGVHILPTFVFSMWGIWNLFYYSSLNQWFSFVAGISVLIVNAWWLSMVFFYRKKKNDTT